MATARGLICKAVGKMQPKRPLRKMLMLALGLGITAIVVSVTGVAVLYERYEARLRTIETEKSIADQVSVLVEKINKMDISSVAQQNQILNIYNLIDRIHNSTAYAAVDGSSYDIAWTKHGPFLLIIRQVSPFLDGYKVKLHIGNLTSGEFSGFEVDAAWGPEWKPEVNYEEWKKSQKTQKFKQTQTLYPGRYTEIELTISPANSAELKKLGFPLILDAISLAIPLPK